VGGEQVKKYVLHPGRVRSANDDDLHFITAPMLAALYHVPIAECWVQEADDGMAYPPYAVHLYPRYDGNYSL
jgi:hypothetical protein